MTTTTRWATAALLMLAGAGASHPLLGQAMAGQKTSAAPRWTAADAEFMTGMIGHHAQAVLMAGWAPTHGASPELQALCERILVGQRDEIRLMQRWLGEWGQPVPEADASMDMMPGMEHMHMPGMLTAAQLIQLDQSRGREFDQLFLLYMIGHHQGALTMVKQLLATPGAARDDNVFKFISDMNADQTTEIKRMSGMLAGLPAEATSPQ
jgi:uncharacterized protein (DUF305 family)